jgi:hypothetical protein
MALQSDRRGAGRMVKRSRKAERRRWRMERAMRFSLWMTPLAAALVALAALIR